LLHPPNGTAQAHMTDPGTKEIVLVEYDGTWPTRFREHAARIAEALGGRAVQIEHIGSTAVPGLAAKPTIDVLLVVTDSGDEATYVPDLEAAGYELRLREPEFHEHRMLNPRTGEANVHVVSAGCREIERWLVFRDRLRSSPSDRDLYERTKRELALRRWPNTDAYASAKSDIVERIIAAGRAGG